MVAEAVGGAWGVAASKIFSQLAKEKSLVTGEREEVLLLQLYQGLGIILHRENARSVLKRLRTISCDTHVLTGAAASIQAPPLRTLYSSSSTAFCRTAAWPF